MRTYERLTAWLLATLVAATAWAQQRVVHVETAGTLPTLISASEKYQITDLKLTGEINGTDAALLRDMGGAKNVNTKTNGRLASLDLSEVRIVSGGSAYFSWAGTDFYTEDDVMGSYMLLYASKIKSLKLPRGIKAIGDQVFGTLTDLKELEIPEGVKSIGIGCFINCNSIVSLRLPDAVETLGVGCFQRMEALREVHLGNGVRELDNSLFLNDNALETVSLGSGVETFDPVIFYTLPKLQQLSCSEDNPHFRSEDGVLLSRDGTRLVVYPCGRDESTYEIPSSVRKLSDNAFRHATALERIEIPAGVEEVGVSCFDGCQALTSVDIRDGLRALREGAFSECIALQRITLPATVETIEGGAFLDCISLTGLEVDAASEHFKMEDGALLTRDGGTLVCLPAGLTGADYALPPSVHTLAPYSMATHSSLLHVYIPETVREVGECAFFGCEQLEEVVFSERIETLGETLFYASDRMDRVYFLGATPPAHVADYALFNDRLAEEGTLYVPATAKSAYEAKQWVVEREGRDKMNMIANIVGMTDEEVEAVKQRVTGINSSIVNCHSSRTYDLQGRLAPMGPLGVYIVEGRKLLKRN